MTRNLPPSRIVGEIRTRRFTARPLRAPDVSEAYARWFQDPEVARFIQAARTRQSVDTLRRYVRDKACSPHALLVGIFTRRRRHLGNLKFEPLDSRRRVAIVGMLIGEARWRNKRVLQEVFPAVAAEVAYRFDVRDFWLGVDVDNARARRSYRRLGFREHDAFPDSLGGRPRGGAISMKLQWKPRLRSLP